MQDLSLHLFDILENSVKAGASRLRVELGCVGTCLSFLIEDDGPGFPVERLNEVVDPYFTTRTERPVGLGLSLLKQSAEEASGGVSISNRVEGGARVEAFFDVSHIDARPLGDIIGTIVGFFVAWPQIELEVVLTHGGEPRTIFDSLLIRQELDGVDAAHPEVRKFIRQMLADELSGFHEWLAAAVDSDWSGRHS